MPSNPPELRLFQNHNKPDLLSGELGDEPTRHVDDRSELRWDLRLFGKSKRWKLFKFSADRNIAMLDYGASGNKGTVCPVVTFPSPLLFRVRILTAAQPASPFQHLNVTEPDGVPPADEVTVAVKVTA